MSSDLYKVYMATKQSEKVNWREPSQPQFDPFSKSFELFKKKFWFFSWPQVKLRNPRSKTSRNNLRQTHYHYTRRQHRDHACHHFLSWRRVRSGGWRPLLSSAREILPVRGSAGTDATYPATTHPRTIRTEHPRMVRHVCTQPFYVTSKFPSCDFFKKLNSLHQSTIVRKRYQEHPVL